LLLSKLFSAFEYTFFEIVSFVGAKPALVTSRRYLQYIFYDKNEQFVSQQIYPVSAAANVCQELQLQLTAPEDGFVQVLVANESSVDVWFDDIEITYTPSMIVQEAHYDPWGMSLTGIEKEGSFGYLFNLSEKQKDPTGSGYFYETDWRGYDPQIGRFRGIDALAGSMPGITPYQYAFNNPVMMNDPSGLVPLPVVGKIATASLPEFTFVGYKIILSPVVAKSIATGIGLTFTSMVGGGGLGAGGCNCGCPNPPCNGNQAAQGAQTSQSPQQGFVPPAGFSGPTVKQGANKVVKQVGKQAVNAVAKQVLKTGARMLLTFGSAPVGELLSPTAAGPSLPDGVTSETWYLEQQRAKNWDFENVSAEELQDIADRVNRGIGDSYDRQVTAWLSNTKSDLVQRILGKLSLYPNVIDPRTGQNIIFPSDIGTRVPRTDRVDWGLQERGNYIREWYQRGYPTPKGGWEHYDIHHIKPREFGGTNDFSNLVPVERNTHKLFNTFWREFIEL